MEKDEKKSAADPGHELTLFMSIGCPTSHRTSQPPCSRPHVIGGSVESQSQVIVVVVIAGMVPVDHVSLDMFVGHVLGNGSAKVEKEFGGW